MSWSLAAALVIGLAGLPLPGRAAAGEDVAFSGRVIDRESGKPVAGATVVVTRKLRSLPAGARPAWVGDTTLKTDAEGRFTIVLTAEQVAEPHLDLAISRVAHPEFIARKGLPVPVATLLQERRYGDAAYFETVTLERGEEFTAQVVTPEGQPAAGVPYEFSNWGGRDHRSPNFADDTSGRTDAQGKVKIRMPKTHALTIRLIPERYAPYVKFWGTAQPSRNPGVIAPTDLGRLVLEPGAELSGRLLDLEGRPIAGERVVAQGTHNQLQREATTAADGTFRFAPLRPGNYVIHAEGQNRGGGIYPSLEPMPWPTRPIRPARVYLKSRRATATVELRELPSVRLEVRFVDSKGRPAPGSWVGLSGTLPNPMARVPAPLTQGMQLASSVNDPEPEDPDRSLSWGCQLAPDAQGRVVFHAPRGLANARVAAFPPDETVAFKTRLEPGAPLKFWGGGGIGNLETDRPPIEIVWYRAPTVLVRVVTNGDEPVPADASLSISFEVRGGSYGGNDVRQRDGRFRSRSLMPDHEYELSAWAKEYVPKRLERLNLAEGATAELTLGMRKKPKRPEVGDRAPAFTVQPTEGPDLRLADFRGTLLLLHVWGPFHQGDRDLHRLNQLRNRYPVDRLAMVGLCLAADADGAARVIHERAFTWPQAILRDRGADPLLIDYGGLWPPRTILIGPDGTILARDLVGDQVDDAVAGLLGKP
jgi:uncharacterized GH25 family protein